VLVIIVVAVVVLVLLWFFVFGNSSSSTSTGTKTTTKTSTTTKTTTSTKTTTTTGTSTKTSTNTSTATDTGTIVGDPGPPPKIAILTQCTDTPDEGFKSTYTLDLKVGGTNGLPGTKIEWTDSGSSSGQITTLDNIQFSFLPGKYAIAGNGWSSCDYPPGKTSVIGYEYIVGTNWLTVGSYDDSMCVPSGQLCYAVFQVSMPVTLYFEATGGLTAGQMGILVY